MSKKNERGLEFKTFGFEVKEATEDGIVTGYASTFGNVDLGLDVVDKGAFKKTLRENLKVPVLADHDPTKQVGWNLKGEEDATGLFVTGQLLINEVQLAKERYALAKKALEIGAKCGLSIGYMTIQASPDANNPRIRHLKEVKLFEYSLVTFPMNVEAMVTAAKSFQCVDRARMLLQQWKELGISRSDIEMALSQEAAAQSYDATALGQSLDKLIEKFKN